MSRVSDTRIRTREAAARLIAAGRRPHELTVDLIYAEIRQGSRTTINDELKLWKDEQAKTAALSEALPPAVANAMMATWAVAVEHGEKVFEQRRDDVENELAVALQRVQTVETDLAREQERAAGLQAQLASRQTEIEALRDEGTRMRAAAEASQMRIQALEHQVESTQAEADQRLAAANTAHQQQRADLQEAMATQEQVFRSEIDRATERLEGVQRHVMLQVADAREGTKRAEALLAKAQQKNDGLSTEAQHLRTHLIAQTQLNEKTQADRASASQVAEQMRTERETLIQQLAMLTGKIEAQTGQIASLEHRAIGAETRLEQALKQPTTAKKKARKV
jgi:chromosome segregation ATPase